MKKLFQFKARILTGLTIFSLVIPNLSNATTVEMISVTPNNQPANFSSNEGAMSMQGQWVAFDSYSNNIVTNDTNNVQDVFLRNRSTSQTIRISQNTNGTQSNNPSDRPVMSDDGNIIAFTSSATNLVSNDTNGKDDIFIYNRTAGTLSIASTGINGALSNNHSRSPHLSPDGRFLTFVSEGTNIVPNDTNLRSDVFLKDLSRNITIRASLDHQGNQLALGADYGQTSADARYVVFGSDDTSVVPNDTNGKYDVFRRDIFNAKTQIVSTSANGTLGNDDSRFNGLGADRARIISDDGRFIGFTSKSTNLVPNDTNQSIDVFLKDMKTGLIERVNLNSSGQQGTVINPFNGGVDMTISGDARFATFSIDHTNLAPNDNNNKFDVFIRDRFLGTTTMISLNSQNASANGYSLAPIISRDGQFLSYKSDASDIPTTPSPPSSGYPTYFVDRQETFAFTNYLGGGCNGANAAEYPTFELTSPAIGSTATMSGSNVQPNAVGAIYYSGVLASPSILAYPCVLHLDLAGLRFFTIVTADANGNWSVNLPIPNDQNLKGLTLSFQAIFSRPGPTLFTLTNGVSARVGN